LRRTRPPPRQIAPGPFKPTWESLTANYKTPEQAADSLTVNLPETALSQHAVTLKIHGLPIT
jgi:hypothetical protein